MPSGSSPRTVLGWISRTITLSRIRALGKFQMDHFYISSCENLVQNKPPLRLPPNILTSYNFPPVAVIRKM
jgi:hypothetical protein